MAGSFESARLPGPLEDTGANRPLPRLFLPGNIFPAAARPGLNLKGAVVRAAGLH